jgi:uncharacterized protein (DUF2132 family)
MPEIKQKDPLHGVTLKVMLTDLVTYVGWKEMATQIEIRCFMFDPSISSSLKFLRRTPWARKKVEDLYLKMLSRQKLDKQEIKCYVPRTKKSR